MNYRPLHILAVCAALGAPALTSPRPAHAQMAQGPAQSSGSDAAMLAKSRELFQQANKLYDEGKYPQAESAYLQAWKLKKSYDIAGNLGNLEADMNKPRLAAEYLSYALREFPAGGRPAMRDALAKRLVEVSKLVGQLRIQVNKPGAEVLIDGQAVGSSPLPGEIYVDAGPHSVEARLEGLPPVLVNVTAHKGKSESVALTLLPPPGPNKTVIGVGAAVGGLGVVVGAVLLGISASKGGTIDDLNTKLRMTGGCASTTDSKCSELRDALNSKATLGNAGVGALVAGGGIGVATLIYGLAGGGSAKAPSRTGIRVVPAVTGDSAGLLVSGAFW